eukprot:CAMPEP_0113638756 /NCGR_PEP_ID=MMETSP0017_2-20120614/20315_1 /TAXON_ID=2856 /ORGANISM="Cylindrotheca closterium" /LENGTH=76 /DNA_ID=CAMNT_0000549903 /DNA_START=53 /DNA_END=283 /DNA_ORIENTATION=- /assembly_acc=CAM_ASM_000147
MKQSLILAALVASASAFAPASVMPKPTTALSAEWEKDWKETNFEADIKKLEKEAEERLDAKIEELKGNIASTGAEN